jgi:predicted O-methyltransferase YrrM
MTHSIGLTPALVSYLQHHNPNEHPVLAKCRVETLELYPSDAWFQISAEQAAFMRFLVRAMSVSRILEIGTFTGYSAIAVALEMAEMHNPKAHVCTIDRAKIWQADAERYCDEAGLNEIIDFRLGNANDVLDEIIDKGCEPYDLIFIDADKSNTIPYYEKCLSLTKVGGILIVDNVLWDGKVVSEETPDLDTGALQAIAELVQEDSRVVHTMCAVGDGLLMCIKQP